MQWNQNGFFFKKFNSQMSPAKWLAHDLDLKVLSKITSAKRTLLHFEHPVSVALFELIHWDLVKLVIHNLLHGRMNGDLLPIGSLGTNVFRIKDYYTDNWHGSPPNIWHVAQPQGHSTFCGALQWLIQERDGASNHRLLDCLLNRLFRRRSKKT